MVDIFNPYLIVIGIMHLRNEDMMKLFADEMLSREALTMSDMVCKVVPATPEESIGNYAAPSVAANIQ